MREERKARGQRALAILEPNSIADRATDAGDAEMPPLVVAELVTGATELS